MSAESKSTELPSQEDVLLAEGHNLWPEVVDVEIRYPAKNTSVFLPSVNTGESLSSIRNALGDFQETAFTTSFKWNFKQIEDMEGNVIPKDDVTACNDYSELNAFLEPNTKKITLDISDDLYDVKKGRSHVKRLREIMQRPYLMSSAKMRGEQAPQVDAEADAETKAVDIKADIMPKLQSLAEAPNLGTYFNEAFRSGVSKAAQEHVQNPLSQVIKSIFVSGWNPAPVHRRLQGDLFYVEVALATEGTFYLTATGKGFFINKSNRNTFDPTPASNHHFHHDLFDVLFELSVNVRNAWNTFCEQSKIITSTVPAPLDHVANVYNNFNGDLFSLPPSSWILPPVDRKNEVKEGFSTAFNTYDMLRAQENIGDLHGAEDLGAPREWNDEIQSIRNLQANDLNEKIIQARLEHRIITEFTESCKKIAMAINDGLIAPLSYMDPSQSDIYVYNGIFFSCAEDTKDSFLICEGEEASRKATSRDVQNQKMIKALEIPGMGTVLCATIDYKGIRYVGQSIVPGIFNQGDNGAQLMYGILDKDKSVTVKNSSLKIYEDLARKLNLAQRNIPSQPFIALAGAQPVEPEQADNGHVDALNKLLRSAETNQSPIKVDEVDNVPVNSENNSIVHIGPVESKLIKGSDGRTYALEVMRLAPRDANFVAGEKGTQKVAEELLSKMDNSLAVTYVLRQELISIYIQRKVNLARQAIYMEANGKVKKAAESAEAKNEDTKAEVDGEKEENDVQIVKEESAKEEEVDESELVAEYAEKLKAITPESLGVEINPNVFLNFDADVDSAVVAKDEELARDMARFLIDSVLPMVTRQVREGEFYPKDNESMVSILHRMGINMRYLGELAKLAQEQEKEDTELYLQGKQRVHSMPPYWLEFLVVELLARSTKHVLNSVFRNDALVSSAPAASIALILNHLLSLFKDETDEAIAQLQAAAPASTEATVEDAADKKAKRNKKNNKKTGAKETTPAATPAAPAAKLEIGGPVSNSVSSREDFLAALNETLIKRYLYEMPLLQKPETTTTEVEEDKASLKKLANAMLRKRVSPLMLVRRVCQQNGIVIAARDYDFKTDSVFHAADILGLIPKVKTCEPETYIPEIPELINSSSLYLQQGNAVGAFEFAQQAVNIVSQITGPSHPHTLAATEQLAAVLLNSADLKSSTQMASRSLALTAQVQGVDSQETIHHHIQMSVLESEQNNHQVALQHLLTAKYLLSVTAGDHHPEMANIFMRLALMYEKVDDFAAAFQCLQRARIHAHDLFKNSSITIVMAGICFRMGKVQDAVMAQKHGYKILKELVNKDDERLIEAKKNLEVYIRALSEAPRTQMELPPASPYISMENIYSNIDDDQIVQMPGGESVVDEQQKPKKKRNNHKKSKAKK